MLPVANSIDCGVTNFVAASVIVSVVCGVGSILGIVKIRENRIEEAAYSRAREIRAELRAAKREFASYGKAKDGAAPGLAALGYVLANALENSDIEAMCLKQAREGRLGKRD